MWYDDPQSVNLAKEIASRSCLTFRGLYIHEGDSYKCRGEDEIKQSASVTFKKLNIFSSRQELIYFHVLNSMFLFCIILYLVQSMACGILDKKCVFLQ